MLKYLLPLMTSSSLIISVTSYADDEYKYLTTPIAIQIDNLQDDDRDGVIDARDLCPDTPLRSDIDNDGCGSYVKAEEQLQLSILFANNSADINPVFRGQIRSMSEFLKQYPSTSIELQGYASKIGNAEYNLSLSTMRAHNVKNALVSHGIDQSRIRIVGFGDTNLAKSGDDEVSRAMNRKVIATVVGHKGSIKEEWSIFTKRDQ